jgi:hypothetical protein
MTMIDSDLPNRVYPARPAGQPGSTALIVTRLKRYLFFFKMRYMQFALVLICPSRSKEGLGGRFYSAKCKPDFAYHEVASIESLQRCWQHGC